MPGSYTERWTELLGAVKLYDIDEYSCIDFFAKQARVLGEAGVPQELWKDKEAWKSRMRITWDCIPKELSQRMKMKWNSKIEMPNSWKQFEDSLRAEAKQAEIWLNLKSSSSSSGRRPDYNPKAPAEAVRSADFPRSDYSRKRKGSQGGGARQGQSRPMKPRTERYDKPYYKSTKTGIFE